MGDVKRRSNGWSSRAVGCALRDWLFVVGSGVSYLYQYLKKTGFFDTVLMEKNSRDA
jgi:hypothetical protein